MKWPWRRRVEEAHRDVQEAARERERVTGPLTERAEKVIREAAARRDDDFVAALEALMKRRRHP